MRLLSDTTLYTGERLQIYERESTKEHQEQYVLVIRREFGILNERYNI